MVHTVMKVIEFENPFSRSDKVMYFRENGRGHEKSNFGNTSILFLRKFYDF